MEQPPLQQIHDSTATAGQPGKDRPGEVHKDGTVAVTVQPWQHSHSWAAKAVKRRNKKRTKKYENLKFNATILLHTKVKISAPGPYK
jgi:hypothetical protein